MNNDFSKLHLHQHQDEESVSLHQATSQLQGREFASVEEMIRTDQEQVEVPAAVAERLNESISKEPKPERPWWKRLLGG